MRISVITVVYNNRDYIRDCLESVLSQSHREVEYIVVDGGSDDGSLDIINEYADRIHKILTEPDEGIYDAMNKGLRLASGEAIGFLNSDDVYADDNVLACVSETLERSGKDTCYGDLEYTNSDMSSVIRYWKSGGYRRRNVLRGWMPPHPTFYVRKKVYDECGQFDTGLRIAADYELILRILAGYGATSEYIPRVLVRMRIGGASNGSLKNMFTKMREDYRAMSGNGIPNPAYALMYKNVSKLRQFIFRR